jgi:hypothetical protein
VLRRLPDLHDSGSERQALYDWSWNHTLGADDGSSGVLPIGVAPPKAGLCTVSFNPIYKFIFIKNTKVAGTSVFLSFGGFCRAGITLEEAKVPCPLLSFACNLIISVVLSLSQVTASFIAWLTQL